MQNELLWIGLLIINFSGVILAYKIFGKKGLYVWTAMAVILANMQVMKTIAIFGFVTALGNVIYSSLFLVTDILCENHSKEDARNAVLIGFFVLIFTTIIMQITLYFIPHASDILSGSLHNIFQFLPRITVASLTAYFVSQNFDVWFYSRIRTWTQDKHLWLRNNLSTFISQIIDNSIFTWIAFVGFGIFWTRVFDWPVILSIFLTSFVLKWIVAILDTPFLYYIKK